MGAPPRRLRERAESGCEEMDRTRGVSRPARQTGTGLESRSRRCERMQVLDWTGRMKLALSVVCIALAAVACGNHGHVVIGDNPDTSGNHFWHSVSDKFDEPELQRLHDELNGPRVRAKLQQYMCPDTLPPFTITVVLWRE